jgi:predicted nucleic acid-binding protein
MVMILLDSNIVIYLRNPSWGEKILRQVEDERLATCNVVVAEVLGYKGLGKPDASYFEQLFETMKNCQFDDRVTKMVIELRRRHTIQLPDAIIAATALVNDLSLCTHNTEDFEKIPDLLLFDPLIA